MFGDRYPRKPLTAEQLRENRAHAARTSKAEAEYERGKELLRARLAKKYSVEWESELEGDWEVVGQYDVPHVAPVDEERLTDDQRKSWESDKQMAKMMRSAYEGMVTSHSAMLARFTTDREAFNGKTITWRRLDGPSSSTSPQPESPPAVDMPKAI